MGMGGARCAMEEGGGGDRQDTLMIHLFAYEVTHIVFGMGGDGGGGGVIVGDEMMSSLIFGR